MSAKDTLKLLKSNENNLFIIHYSCENLNDNNENYSPRITSIAVLHVGSSTMHSFSIHLIAEVKKINREDIHEHYDTLEGEMLKQFFGFVSENDDAYWLHWNMTNINYGFQALAHRYKVLTQQDSKRIPDTKKYNLSALILSIYGKDCVNHPRMASFMKLNNGEHRDNLSGKDEVAAFSAKEYVKLHKSTMSKVYWFQHMYFLLQQNKVKVHNKNWGYKVNHFLEKPNVKVLGFVAVLFSIFQLIQFGWSTYEMSKQKNNAEQAEVKSGTVKDASNN
ncbi:MULTISPECIES: hypothetical protein [Brenneria]|uniref:Uncharacterized protein n=1 Tax=Brenneria nigrifluens DSM 30175 = ATCC 13028 TaxID=1121120 RepID=A0A2U1UK79_9GAMM|nr:MULTISPECIES: hypothetical protein [Brenneria]EHD20385.1 hypothetical protein BrE312_0946 [Brenneria sp. EniD312]PWC22063.1 hypothetical protein DDT54_17625 [Brenneria nigrifluens DSM 30175 = ATCC 13028]QCR03588.1 hypothetical protein EH206_04840 [Brenneria nigrifluens DSM 30175 = ATCC 13028]